MKKHLGKSQYANMALALSLLIGSFSLFSITFGFEHNNKIAFYTQNQDQRIQKQTNTSPFDNFQSFFSFEDDIPEDILIDHRVTVYIPIRDELDRAMSGLIQELNDEIVDKSIKDIETYIKRKITYNNTYYPFLSYKKIQTIEYFWRFIFLSLDL